MENIQDAKKEYEIRIKTLDGKTIIFRPCSHKDNAPKNQ